MGRGCDKAFFMEKKGFSVKGGGTQSMRIAKEFYRQRQFSEEVRAIQ